MDEENEAEDEKGTGHAGGGADGKKQRCWQTILWRCRPNTLLVVAHLELCWFSNSRLDAFARRPAMLSQVRAVAAS